MNRTSTGHTPYGPLQRRLLGLAGFISLLIIGLVVFHTLHTGETGLNAVAEAAERTAQQPGAKLAMEVTYTAEGTSTKVVGNGSGVYNARTGRTEFSLSVPLPGRAPVKLEAVGDEKTVYMRSPLFAGELPEGKEWLGVEPMLGQSSQTALGSNGSAKSTLDMLRAVGSGAEKLDQQTVRGHLTTRYKGTIEPARVVELMKENGEAEAARVYEAVATRAPAAVPVEVWVDEHGLARQVSLDEQIPTTAGPTVNMEMRMQFYAFGSRPKIALPPKHKVFDMTPVVRAELGLDDGHSLGALKPPAGAKSLTAAAFRSRARNICRGVLRAGGVVVARNSGLVEEVQDAKAEGDPGRISGLTGPYADRIMEPLDQIVRGATVELAKLPAPSRIAPRYHHYLVALTKDDEHFLALTRALEVKDLKSPVIHATAQEKAETKARERLAGKLGIATCEQPVRIGSPGSAAQTTLQ